MSIRVLHVVSSAERRGAEMFAADLIGALNTEGVLQSAAVLHSSNGLSVRFEAETTVLNRQPSSQASPFSPRTFAALNGLVARWKPDLIQAHGGEALKYAVPGTVGRPASVVYRRIGATPASIAGPVRTAAYAKLMRSASRVVTVAEASRRETMARFRIQSERIVTIPNAVDSRRIQSRRDREDVRRELGIEAAAPVLVSLGALTWEKDPTAHLDVAQRAARELPDLVHLVVGDGPVRPKVEQEVGARGLTGTVRLLGSRSDVPDILAAGDVLLLASATEGMPAAVIEAGMAGLPVAAYGVAGVPEVVVHEETGLLATPGRVDELASAVVRLLQDREARALMGKQAAERCRSLFDISVVAPRYLDLYRELAR